MVETLFSGELDTAVVAAEKKAQEMRTTRLSLVAFELSGELYGVSIDDVAEISRPLPLVPLPHVPPHILGLTNLRGIVLPVIDLRRRFCLPIRPDNPDNRLVLLKTAEYQVALWVDAIHGLLRLSQADFQPAPPNVARIDPEYYNQVAQVDERLLIELNCQKLLANTAVHAQKENQK